MSTINLCLGLNSRINDLLFITEIDVTTIQIGDLCISDDVDSYIQRFISQISKIDSCNIQKALLLPLVAPSGNKELLEAIILAACDAGINEIIANSLGEIRTVRRLGIDAALTASDFVCCYCLQDVKVLQDYGVNRVRLSPEMSFGQISALASKAPIPLQVTVYGRIILGVLQEFSRLEACEGTNDPLMVCNESDSEVLFQIHGNEIISERSLDLLGHINDFEKVGISEFFIDARYLDERNIKTACGVLDKSSSKLTTIGDDATIINAMRDLETIPTHDSFCNGWFHGKPGIGDFR